jgi:hypothetical protein
MPPTTGFTPGTRVMILTCEHLPDTEGVIQSLNPDDSYTVSVHRRFNTWIEYVPGERLRAI